MSVGISAPLSAGLASVARTLLLLLLGATLAPTTQLLQALVLLCSDFCRPGQACFSGVHLNSTLRSLHWQPQLWPRRSRHPAAAASCASADGRRGRLLLCCVCCCAVAAAAAAAPPPPPPVHELSASLYQLWSLVCGGTRRQRVLILGGWQEGGCAYTAGACTPVLDVYGTGGRARQLAGTWRARQCAGACGH